MSGIEHRVRSSLRDKETTFRLSDDALVLDDGEEQRSIPYGDIRQLNLVAYTADIADPDDIHGQLTIKTGLTGSLKLRSHHFKSIGSYERRAESYAPFVRELSRRVAAHNPSAQFISGAATMRILWLVLLLLTGFVAVMFAIALIAEGWQWDIASGAIMGALLAYMSWQKFRGNREVTFDPADPPADLIEL